MMAKRYLPDVCFKMFKFQLLIMLTLHINSVLFLTLYLLSMNAIHVLSKVCLRNSILRSPVRVKRLSVNVYV